MEKSLLMEKSKAEKFLVRKRKKIKQAQGRKKGYHSVKEQKNSFVKANGTGRKKSPSN